MSLQFSKNAGRSISSYSKTLHNKQIVVINGSMKGINKFCRKFLNQYIILDTSEETLHQIKKYHKVKSYYLYDPADLKEMTIHDIGMPTMSLYDEYINISVHQ